MTLARHAVLCSSVALVLTGLSGCGGTADVTGKVSYKGKLLASGTVSMVGPDGLVRQGIINGDGTYAIAGVAAGKVQLGVSSPRPGGAERGGRRGGRGIRRAPDGAAQDASGWFAIPNTYLEPTTSG